MLSLDVMDISGEHQHDLSHNIDKTRLSKEGRVLQVEKNGRQSWWFPDGAIAAHEQFSEAMLSEPI